MDAVSNVDRLVLLLRQRLEERDRTRRPGAPLAKRADQKAAERTTVQALAAAGDVDDRQFRRALVQGLLTDRLGLAMVNEAGFQQVVDRVVQTIESDAETRRLLDRISDDLKGLAG